MKQEENVLFGGVEAGGTKFVCAVGDLKAKIWEKIVIPTTTPEETMPQVIEFFKRIHAKTPLAGIGIASFGPVDPNPHSDTYGYITTTPKPGWAHYNILGTMKTAFDLPMGFDTDVNGAAMGEYRWGAARNLHSFVYVTVGTGIGGGGMIDGKLIHGAMHPEMGHIFVPHNRVRDSFEGVCPFHGDCLEGLASGPSLKRRWDVDSAMDLPSDHPAWSLEADYLAYAFANFTLMFSPQRIIVGGGVMRQTHLYDLIRPKVLAFLNGYIKQSAILDDIEHYIMAPGLGEQSGICGAIALAEKAYQEEA